MADKLFDEPPKIDYSKLITDEYRPVDNCFSEKQQHILPDVLDASWPEGKPFIALNDVGLFSNLKNQDTVAPDFMLSLGVEQLPFSGAPESRSYFMWVYGKAPDLVIELVSNKIGGELGERKERYRKIRVTYYAVYDPLGYLGKIQLRLFRLEAGQYVEMTPTSIMPGIGLGLTIWEGVYRSIRFRWLRFVDEAGRLLHTAQENAEAALQAQATARSSASELIASTLKARFEEVPPDLATRLQALELTALFPLAQRAATAGSLEEFLGELSPQ